MANQLYHHGVNQIKKQGIWKVFQLLASMKYEHEQCYVGFSLPKLILRRDDYPKDYFPDSMNLVYYAEDFDAFKDCKAIIDEYEKDKNVKMSLLFVYKLR